jgi:CTP:molybdopterin cytidylyltransferase MocA
MGFDGNDDWALSDDGWKLLLAGGDYVVHDFAEDLEALQSGRLTFTGGDQSRGSEAASGVRGGLALPVRRTARLGADELAMEAMLVGAEVQADLHMDAGILSSSRRVQLNDEIETMREVQMGFVNLRFADWFSPFWGNHDPFESNGDDGATRARVSVVIPAAGRASRMASIEGGERVHKPLLRLSRNRTILDSVLAMAKSVSDDVVVGVPEGMAKVFAGSGGPQSVRWIECGIGIGLTRTVQQLLGHVDEHDTVVLILADDFSVPNDLTGLVTAVTRGAWSAQGVVHEADPKALSRACEVRLVNDHMVAIVEKPKTAKSGWRGCGIYCLSPLAAKDLRAMDPEGVPGLSEAYASWLADGHLIGVMYLDANVNINTGRDLEVARGLFAQLSTNYVDGNARTSY